jgi:hypothetical protein
LGVKQAGIRDEKKESESLPNHTEYGHKHNRKKQRKGLGMLAWFCLLLDSYFRDKQKHKTKHMLAQKTNQREKKRCRYFLKYDSHFYFLFFVLC